MKKMGIFISLIFIFLMIYLLQSNFFSWFHLAGVKPNLIIIYVLFIGLFAGKGIGTSFGILFGIILDSLIGKSIGNCAILLGVIGFLGGYLDKSFSKESRITMVIMMALATFLYETGFYVLNFFIHEAEMNMVYYLRTIFIELFFNTLLTIIVYPLLLKFGYHLQETFKENQILTRYF